MQIILYLCLFITFPLPACMILLIELGVCFPFFIGLVRSGLGCTVYVLCLLSLFVLLQLCNWYIRAYIYTYPWFGIGGIITLFLYHSSILDRVSSQKKKKKNVKLNRQLTANKQHQDIHTKGQTTNKWQVTKKCCVWYDNNSKIGSDRFNSNKSNSKPNPIHNPPFTHSLFEFLFLFFCSFSIILSAS